MRIIAIDPAVRNTGFAVLEESNRKTQALEYGTITIPAKVSHVGCLVAIFDHISNLIKKWSPDECAVEGVIFVQSHETAIRMGAARGAALLAAGRLGLPSYEYAPRRVKQAIVGKGSATKDQVAFMVRALLGLSETPAPDSADALAIGIAHLMASDPIKSKLLERKLV